MKLATLAFAAVLAASGAASAAAVDWNEAHQFGVIEILTIDPDGANRDTNVWVAALDGHGYVRTNDSRWFQNLTRDPDAAIRFGGVEYPVRAGLVRDPALRARVDAVFAEKYPISTWIAQLFGRTGGVNCLELSARPR